MGSIKHHINSLGPSQETYKEATKTKTSSFVRKIYVHWNLTRWEKQIKITFQNNSRVE